MKAKERKFARKLRSLGWPLRAISKHVRCSKSAVSGWIADIKLTKEQIEKLRSNQDKARAKAATHPIVVSRNGRVSEILFDRNPQTRFHRDTMLRF